jgi:hypothetical protein
VPVKSVARPIKKLLADKLIETRYHNPEFESDPEKIALKYFCHNASCDAI